MPAEWLALTPSELAKEENWHAAVKRSGLTAATTKIVEVAREATKQAPLTGAEEKALRVIISTVLRSTTDVARDSNGDGGEDKAPADAAAQRYLQRAAKDVAASSSSKTHTLYNFWAEGKHPLEHQWGFPGFNVCFVHHFVGGPPKDDDSAGSSEPVARTEGKGGLVLYCRLCKKQFKVNQVNLNNYCEIRSHCASQEHVCKMQDARTVALEVLHQVLPHVPGASQLAPQPDETKGAGGLGDLSAGGHPADASDGAQADAASREDGAAGRQLYEAYVILKRDIELAEPTVAAIFGKATRRVVLPKEKLRNSGMLTPDTLVRDHKRRRSEASDGQDADQQ